MDYNFPYTQLDPLLDDRTIVIEIRQRALELLAEGKSVMKWEGEGNSGEFAWTAPVGDVLTETRMCLRLMDGLFPVRQSQQWRLS